MSFLCDITDQKPIPGMDDDRILRSKLGRDEAQRMLVDIAGALGLEWGDYLRALAEAWRVRRDAKARRLGWFDGEEGGARGPLRRPRVRRAAAAAPRMASETWVQLCLF